MSGVRLNQRHLVGIRAAVFTLLLPFFYILTYDLFIAIFEKFLPLPNLLLSGAEKFPAILSTDKSVIVGALGTRHTARSSSVNTALGARNPLRKSTTLTSEARRSAQLKERAYNSSISFLACCTA